MTRRTQAMAGAASASVRWATRLDQANNRRSSRIVEWAGESLTLAEWGRRTGIRPITIHARLKKGWPVEEALTEPVRVKHAGSSGSSRPPVSTSRQVAGGPRANLKADAGWLHVVHQVKLVRPRLVFGLPKNDRDRRVPLPGSVAGALRLHMKEHSPVAVAPVGGPGKYRPPDSPTGVHDDPAGRRAAQLVR
jgi:hypothetical protein